MENKYHEYRYIFGYKNYDISNPEEYKEDLICFRKEVTDDFAAVSYAFDYMKTFPRNYYYAEVARMNDFNYGKLLNIYKDEKQMSEERR